MTEENTLRKYESFEELVRHVEQRREALRYKPIPNLRLQIQHYLYMIGESNSSYFVPISKTPWASEIPRETIDDIVTGASIAYELSREAFTGIFRTGGNSSWATTDEAERRAKICANCPKNLDLQKTPFQRLTTKLAGVFSVLRNTSYDEQLKECGVCGCPNQTKVHFAASLIRKATPEKFKPEDFPESFVGTLDRERHECWVRQILEKGR